MPLSRLDRSGTPVVRMMAMQTIRLDQRGPVLWIWLSRPAMRNAFNDELVRELAAVFSGLDAATRIVVLTGEGSAFSAGADLAWMRRAASFTEEENVAEARALAALFEAVDTSQRVVIGRVNGPALGGAVGLVACCDVVVAADGSRFGFTEVRLGLVPAVISPFVLRKLGAGAARRYFLTGELFDAVTAQRLGLVHEVVPAEQLDAAVESVCGAILAGGPQAVAAAKRLIREMEQRRGDDARLYASELIARLRVSREGQEGLSAFLDKRPPSWAGDS